MNPASALTPLHSLRTEHQLMASLLDVLRQEQQHLVAADIEALTLATTRKSALVGQLAQLAAQRHRALAGAGYPAEEAGMAAWIADSGDAEAAPLWQALLAQTHDAKELNRINGMLINKHIGHTQGALQALRPLATASSQFYGPSGMTTTTSRSRGFLAG